MEEDNSFVFKLTAAVGIFFIGLVGGLLPGRIRSTNATLISLLNITSGGVFLGGGFMHLLPEAQEDLKSWDYRYPYTALFACTGFLVALIIEEVALSVTRRRNQVGTGIVAGKPFLDKRKQKELMNNGGGAGTTTQVATEVVEEEELGIMDISLLRSMSQVFMPRQDIVYRDVFADRDPHARRKQGFLMKRGRMRKNWQKRWIVLNSSSIEYFVTPGGEPKGQVLLHGAAVMFVPERRFKQKHVIEVASIHRSLFLAANNAEQVREWAIAITEAIFSASQMGKHNSTSASTGGDASLAAAGSMEGGAADAGDAPLLASSSGGADDEQQDLRSHLQRMRLDEQSENDSSVVQAGGWDAEDTHGGHSHGVPAEETSIVVAVMLLIALSFHSIMAGLALGAHSEEEWGVLIAIVSHKGLAAFALGTSMVRSAVPVSKRFMLLIGFSCTTPLGIAIGGLFATSSSGPSASAVLLAISSGTFLYVALFELIPKELSLEGHRGTKLFCVICGFGLMALLAKWS